MNLFSTSSSAGSVHPVMSRNDRLSLFASTFIWLSGASPKAAAGLSPSQRRLLVGAGLVVLVPVSLSCLSAAYVASLYTSNWALIIGCGLFWGVLVALLEQYILASLSKSKGKRFVQGAMRLLMAGAIGLFVSHPLTLRILHDRLSTYIEQQRQVEITALNASAVAEVSQLQQVAYQEAQPVVEAPPATVLDVGQSKMATTAATMDPYLGLRSSISAEEANSARLWNYRAELTQALARAKAKWQDEIDGKLGGRLAKRGKEADRIEEKEVRPVEEELKQVSEAIKVSDRRLEALRAQLAEQERLDAERNAALAAKAAAVALAAREQAQRLHEQAIAEREQKAKDLESQKEKVRARYAVEMARIQVEPRNDLMTRDEALFALAKQYPFVWAQYGLLLLVLLMLDTVPVVVKLFSDATHYDMLKAQEDWCQEQDNSANKLHYPKLAEAKARTEIANQAAAVELGGVAERFQGQLELVHAMGEEFANKERQLTEILASAYQTASKVPQDEVREAAEETLAKFREAYVTALQDLTGQLAQSARHQGAI